MVICDSKMHWAKACPHKSNYAVNMAESLSETEDKTVCDEEVRTPSHVKFCPGLKFSISTWVENNWCHT